MNEAPCAMSALDRPVLDMGTIDRLVDTCPKPFGPTVTVFLHPDSSLVPQGFRDNIAYMRADKRRWRRFLRQQGRRG